MNALLDTLGATVIGAMFMLTILNSLFNVQAISTNFQRQINLLDQTERVTNILDTYYLSAAGRSLSSNSSIITRAKEDRFTFRGELDGNIRLIDIRTGAIDTLRNAYPLAVYVDGTKDYGPFWVSTTNDGAYDGIRITYYDRTGNTLSYSNLQNQSIRNQIRSLKFELELVYETYREDMRAMDNKHQITFWKYLTNLYL